MSETPPTNGAFFAFVDTLRARYECTPLTDETTARMEREINAWLTDHPAVLDCGCRLRRVAVEDQGDGVVEIIPEQHHLECPGFIRGGGEVRSLIDENEKLKTILKEVLDIAEEHAIYFGSGIEDVQIETLKRCRKLLEAEETYPWPTDSEVAD